MNPTAELKSATWRKASRSTSDGGNCIEVAPLSNGRVAIRDTESPDQAPYVVRHDVWTAFIDGAKNGEFDF
ncbi:DUF397 domain-containing protein [Nonomuraea sp. NPDC046570]|uniref:DUF397 domain-containing protein n=1 Tax=Nonomuraea sp. NPDC046570 TaxID=3155255 RepID=UPI0033F8EB77